jgi:hypothetical protein
MDWTPVKIHVADLFFTPEIVAHLARHDVSERNVRRVLAGSPRFFNNLPGRIATHAMIDRMIESESSSSHWWRPAMTTCGNLSPAGKAEQHERSMENLRRKNEPS